MKSIPLPPADQLSMSFDGVAIDGSQNPCKSQQFPETTRSSDAPSPATPYVQTAPCSSEEPTLDQPQCGALHPDGNDPAQKILKSRAGSKAWRVAKPQSKPQRFSTAAVQGEDRLMRAPEVNHVTGLSKSSRYRLQSEGKFPLPILLSKNTVGWLASEIYAWIADRINETRFTANELTGSASKSNAVAATSSKEG